MDALADKDGAGNGVGAGAAGARNDGEAAPVPGVLVGSLGTREQAHNPSTSAAQRAREGAREADIEAVFNNDREARKSSRLARRGAPS
jgi:hypothetical protein